jgi:DNA segregation ATPase FtsK/SpoIIIE-like protein
VALLLFVALGWSATQGSGGGAFGALCRGLASPFRWLGGETALTLPLLLGLMGVLQLVGVTPARRRPWFARALLTPFVAAAAGGALGLLAGAGASAAWGGALGEAYAASFGGLVGRWAGGLAGSILAGLVLLVVWGASPWRWPRAEHPVGRGARALLGALGALMPTKKAPRDAKETGDAAAGEAARKSEEEPRSEGAAETSGAAASEGASAAANEGASAAASEGASEVANEGASEVAKESGDEARQEAAAEAASAEAESEKETSRLTGALAPSLDEPLQVSLLPESPAQDARVAELIRGLEALGQKVQRVIEETAGVALAPGEEKPTVGLSFVRFRFGKAPGQKRSVSQVDKAALDLGVETGRAPVRVEVTDAITVELPLSAEERRFAPVRALLEEVGPGRAGRPSYLLGRRHDGRPFEVEVRQAKHVLVGGATGGGKTVCLHSIVFGLAFRHRPSEVRLCLHDPKLVGFHRYARLPHLWHKVITTEPELRELEERLREELERRKKALAADPGARFFVLVTVLDEFSAPSELLTRLIAEARAFDMFFVLATQHPRADVVPTPIKANLTTGIAFRVRDASASRLIVGVSDASALLPHGDCLVQTPDGLERVQAAWVREEDLAALGAALNEQVKTSDEA